MQFVIGMRQACESLLDQGAYLDRALAADETEPQRTGAGWLSVNGRGRFDDAVLVDPQPLGIKPVVGVDTREELAG